MAYKDTWSTKSDESREKCRAALRRGQETRKRNLETYYRDTPTEKLGIEYRRRKVFEEQGECCLHCGIKDWMGQPISFELDHIDGNTKNNLRENLRMLCPNCHSQTPTWRGRGRGRK